MKRIFTILAIISCAIAVIFSVLPISNLAIFPAALALVFCGIAYYLSKKTGEVKKIIQFTFLLTVCALSITTYKAFFIKNEVVNTPVLTEKEDQFEEEAIEELENLDLENIEIEDVEINDIEIEDINLEK